MWSLPKDDEFLPSVPMARLQRMYDGEVKAKPKVRLLSAIHRKRGKSIDDIALLVRASRNTVHSWLRKFVERGIDGKDSIKQTGRPTLLSLRQRKQLVKRLERGAPHSNSGLWSTKEVRELIRKEFGIKFVPQHVWRILVGCGFSLQVPRPRHYKTASPEEIERFKKKPKDKSSITGRKVLSWAAKMRQHSASSQQSHAVGLAKEASQ